MNEYLLGIYKEVGKSPEVIKIKNQKEYLEKLLDGEIATLDYDDYTIINDFLVSSESRDIRIEDYSGKMQINGEEVSIENQAVIEALQRVMTTNGLNRVQKSGHTIDYQIWTRLSDASCGLAFSNAEGFEPTILYVTELVPLQYDGWYYYAEDYNEWRVNN